MQQLASAFPSAVGVLRRAAAQNIFLPFPDLQPQTDLLSLLSDTGRAPSPAHVEPAGWVLPCAFWRIIVVEKRKVWCRVLDAANDSTGP